ncbi:MAG: septal ring lytic transglycosylase RlpA family protein [Sediminispirochaetaceae bacterium]
MKNLAIIFILFLCMQVSAAENAVAAENAGSVDSAGSAETAVSTGSAENAGSAGTAAAAENPGSAASSADQQSSRDSPFSQTGYASWYGGKFQGRQTASGEIFDTHKLTAAHKTLPFGTIVTVTNLKNGKKVDVRINDRGPFVKGRIIDLSMAAAGEIDLLGDGVGRVRIDVARAASGPFEYEAGRPEAEHYSIQVASFREEKNARTLYTTLESNGLDPQFESSGEGYIRVVIHGLDEEELESAIDELSSLGHTSVLVRRHFARNED